jgi:hypothetical protein
MGKLGEGLYWQPILTYPNLWGGLSAVRWSPTQLPFPLIQLSLLASVIHELHFACS